MMVNRTDGSGETNVCGAHASTMPHGAASCGTLLQMEEGDELYAKGHGTGSLYADSPIKHSLIEAYLLYRANP